MNSQIPTDPQPSPARVRANMEEMKDFSSPSSFLSFIDTIADRLLELGEDQLSKDCREKAHDAYTTSSEWLGEIRLVLGRAEKSEGVRKSDTLQKDIQEAVQSIRQAWDRANRS